MELDRTTFTPTINIASYTEESRSTFKNSSGRVSIILVSKREYVSYTDEEILELVLLEYEKIGIYIKDLIKDFRVVRHIDKFYDFSFNNDYLRPGNKTSLKGLFLTGDYTRQKWFSTMEGAVVSGLKVADFIIKEKDN